MVLRSGVSHRGRPGGCLDAHQFLGKDEATMLIWPIVSALFLIACGSLAAASVITKKRPDATEIIEKLRKYQGWIGVSACAVGLLCFIWALVSLRHASAFSGGVWVAWRCGARPSARVPR